jgi:enoyl-CoA hydratase/carnithine racemase
VTGKTGHGPADLAWPPTLAGLDVPAWEVVDLDQSTRSSNDQRGQGPTVRIARAAQGKTPSTLDDFDLYVTDQADPPAPWISGGDDALSGLLGAIDRAPIASVVLVQLLRMGDSLDRRNAVIAESLAYGALQDGPEHTDWLHSNTAPTSRDVADDEASESEDRVLVHRTEDRLEVMLNRARKRNAIDVRMRDALVDALSIAAVDPAISVVEVRGSGSNFSSGGDLSEFGMTPNPTVAHMVRSGRSLPLAALEIESRLTSFVHGETVGAGVELAAFSGRLVAALETTFRLPEIAMGLIPGAGGTVSISRRVGRCRTAALAISGAVLTADAAQRWGLVDEVVPFSDFETEIDESAHFE